VRCLRDACAAMPPVDEAKEEAERFWALINFRTAVDRGDTEAVDEQLSGGVINPSQKMTDGSTWTVLMLAANAGQASLVDKFTSKSRMPKIDEQDPNGFQAIHVAALKGHDAICKTLLDKKVDMNAKNGDGETPLMMAAAEGHVAVVQLLLDAGADPDALDKNDMSAIKKASRWGRTECVKALLTKVTDDPRQMKHCLLFGKLYGHDELLQIIQQILNPSEEVEVFEEEAVAAAA